jgi:PTS system nitrogen regulatory IIA component
MTIADFLTPERVLLNVKVRDKAHLIGDIARAFGRSAKGLAADQVETALLVRERLGSTGLGAGFALPHARIEGLDRFTGLFLRLAKPVAFDAIDGKPVELVFVLLIPAAGETPHVGALAAISRVFRDAAFVSDLRQAATPAEAFRLLTGGG